MAMNSESGNTVLKLWRLMHQIRDILVLCEDSIFAEYGITTEQFSVLAAVKSRDGSLRPTDLARLLERSPNSISMLVDRMVKAGLVKRARDRRDRRVVHVSLTSKGETALKPAMPASWELIQKILSPLSDEDKHTFVNLHEVVKYRALEYLNPGVDIKEMQRSEVTSQANLVKRLVQYIAPSTPDAKRQGDKKKKTI